MVELRRSARPGSRWRVIVPPERVGTLDQLDRLREDRSGGTAARCTEFYFRLTGIVRGNTLNGDTAVMAAEQTTDEFLAAAGEHPSLGGRYATAYFSPNSCERATW